MKHLRFILVLAALCIVLPALNAQPQKSRVQTNKNASAQQAGAGTAAGISRADLMFPTAVDVPEDVTWRRDLYRTLDLSKDENAALYFPVEPQGKQINFFTLVFQLFNTGKLPVYEYQLDGIENFASDKRMHFKDFLEKYHIYYEVQGNSIKVDQSDIPSAQVLSLFIKESSYYDQNTATYHSRVTAICPVMHDNDEFSFGDTKKPLFWIKYDDLKKYLSSHTVMVSNYNNAATMSMDDFFSTNHYKGDIYMTTNMQGKPLAQTVASPDSLKSEQARIEKQMADFEKHIWSAPVDSIAQARKDSIAAATSKKSKAKTARPASTTRKESVSKSKEKKSSSSSSSSSSARVSVRRQRH